MFSTSAFAIVKKGPVDCCNFFVTYSYKLTDAAKGHSALIIWVEEEDRSTQDGCEGGVGAQRPRNARKRL